MTAKKSSPISPVTEYLYQNLEFDTPTKFANELMFAKHSLRENEMKIWLLTVASLAKEKNLNHSVLYEYNISLLADKLNINKDKGWRNIIREAIDHVSDKSLKIVKRYSSEEDKHNWLKIPLYNSVEYNDFNDTVSVSINQKMLPYLQDFTEKFTEVDIDEMLAIRGITQLKVFMVVKELIAEGTYTISIDRFKDRLNIPVTSYANFRDFQRDVLKKAEQQIRKNTSLTQFHFSHNGKGRRAATTITIHLSDVEGKVLPAPKRVVTTEDKIAELDAEHMRLFDEYSSFGIKPEATCLDLINNYSLDVLKSNLAYYKDQLKKRKPDQEPLSAGYLITCVKKDYAKSRRKTWLRKADTNGSVETELQKTDMQLEDVYKTCKNNAGVLIKKGKLPKLLAIFDTAVNSMENMAMNMGIPFDASEARIKIQKRDLRNKETMLFREHLAQRLMSGYITMDSML
ncbi:putative initiator Rep protein (plasmid) [Selenomonas ruminantium subsp. lactilytica TAM6421]|uniref:Putative initiator Rep protein n=1 Tax=Selenomonas ruminantium subsp. lactilytica (strain NBRC 103574 / TAM6421) TaxID=927704 RepID=I0GVM3_SELRL|nr:replication initiation protein [Selenomonas ruminantium]BAL84810.1 putative initiator Rep protein [Selenomonas ruminantium subsp. lactilytica TAM6421]